MDVDGLYLNEFDAGLVGVGVFFFVVFAEVSFDVAEWGSWAE